MKRIIICAALAGVVISVTGCMTVREDKFATTAHPSDLKDARVFVGITGKRQRIRNNPFFVRTKEINPYTIFIQVYVFDEKYQTVTIESPTYRVDHTMSIPLADRRSQAVPFEKAYDGYKFKDEYPGVTPRQAMCMLTLDTLLSYETNTSVEVSAVVVLETDKGAERRNTIDATLTPYRSQDSGSWWQCLRLIFTGM
jgi:hypothetical protein